MNDSLPAHSPKYATFDASRIDLVIEHPKFGAIPFTASADDAEPLGQSLHARAVAGEFGDIAPYDGPPPPDPLTVLADAVRSERDQRLAALDSVISNPLRWAEFTAEQQAAIATYRQALLDVPQQAGFPENVVWPDAPGFLYSPSPGGVGQVPVAPVAPPGPPPPGTPGGPGLPAWA